MAGPAALRKATVFPGGSALFRSEPPPN